MKLVGSFNKSQPIEYLYCDASWNLQYVSCAGIHSNESTTSEDKDWFYCTSYSKDLNPELLSICKCLEYFKPTTNLFIYTDSTQVLDIVTNYNYKLSNEEKKLLSQFRKYIVNKTISTSIFNISRIINPAHELAYTNLRR